MIKGHTHFLTQDIPRVKLPKLYAATAYYEERMKYRKMAEESLKQNFNESLDDFDDNIGHVVRIQFADALKKIFLAISFLAYSITIVTHVCSSKCAKI